MKKLICILVLLVGFQMSAQDEFNWLTDYKVALKQSDTQNKPILAFVINNQNTENLEVLKKEFFGSEGYKKLAPKVILLKLDVSNTTSYNFRMGIHYTKQKSTTGLALVDKYNATMGKPLVDFTPENIEAFISFINSKFTSTFALPLISSSYPISVNSFVELTSLMVRLKSSTLSVYLIR